LARKSSFEATVLTHLEYIKKKQDEHDSQFKTIELMFQKQHDTCDKRFVCIEKDINVAKGFAKGATILGVGALLTAITSFFNFIMGGR